MLTGELKARAIDVVQAVIAQLQKRRALVDDEAVRQFARPRKLRYDYWMCISRYLPNSRFFLFKMISSLLFLPKLISRWNFDTLSLSFPCEFRFCQWICDAYCFLLNTPGNHKVLLFFFAKIKCLRTRHFILHQEQRIFAPYTIIQVIHQRFRSSRGVE